MGSAQLSGAGRDSTAEVISGTLGGAGSRNLGGSQVDNRLRQIGRVALLLLVVCVAVRAESQEPDASAVAAFTIGVEDVLKIYTYGHDDLTLSVTVRPDGRITIPLVQDVMAAGLTPEQLAVRLNEELGKFIRAPTVTVAVEAINSYRVYFLGEIGQQGEIQFQRPVTLLQAISAAGGLSEYSKKEVTIIRVQGGAATKFSVDLKPLLSGKTLEGNVRLAPDDTVIVQ
jgi:polysaccharide export outer membrane protein